MSNDTGMRYNPTAKYESIRTLGSSVLIPMEIARSANARDGRAIVP